MTEEEIERAAIIEYEANKTREEAELLAVIGERRPPTHSLPRCQCDACINAGRATVLG